MKKYHIFRTLLILTIAFFYLETKAQTFPVTNLLIHGWEKIDALNFGTLDTSTYKTILWNSSDHKFYKIGGYNSTTGKDSLFVSYCSGCLMTTGWKLNGDTLKIDTSYVNKIIKDSLNAHWIALNGLIQDTANIVHWSDTTSIIATKHDVDTLSNSVYDSLSNHYDLIHGLDTGKVNTSGDIMYGDLNVNADVYADTVHATVKQPVYLNSLASWDSQGVLNDTIIPNNVSDPLYNKIVAIRPNKHDTSFANIDLVANTTLFPKGSYFHFYKGSYTPTINLARDSCVLYFDKGAIVTKTTAGAIFDYSTTATYKNDINILGYGSFYKTTNTGEVFKLNSNTNTLTINLEFNIISSTTDKCITIVDVGGVINSSANIKGNNCISSASNCIYIYSNIYYNASINFDIDVKYITSTADYAINLQNIYGGKTKINSDIINGSTGFAFYNIQFGYTYINSNIINGAFYSFDSYPCYINATSITSISGKGTFNVKSNTITSIIGINQLLMLNIQSSITTVTINEYRSIANITGIVGTLNISAGNCSINGTLQNLNCSGTSTNVNLNLSSPLQGSYYSQNYQVSGGNVNIINSKNEDIDCSLTLNSTGGYIEFLNTLNFNGVHNSIVINGGYVQFDNGFKTGRQIYLQSGTLRLTGKFYNQNIDNLDALPSLIVKTGGVLILDDATLIKRNFYSPIINCPSSAQNIKIYSGGCNTNGTTGDLLSAKARKDSLIVTAVATTTIILNDGSGGAETFTETDVATYNTTALMAARMAALINASGTLDITATYVAGATFNIESDVAGTNYTQSGLVNLTNKQLRLNSYAITDLTGGSIIEDSDVSY